MRRYADLCKQRWRNRVACLKPGGRLVAVGTDVALRGILASGECSTPVALPPPVLSVETFSDATGTRAKR